MTAAVMGILMLGIGGTLAFTFEASDRSISPAGRNRTSKEVLDRITRDLSESLAFSERSSRVVSFTVPDRDGDSIPETIRYAWSGAAGDPLTLEHNGGPAQTIAEGVQRFNLAYLLRTVGPPPGACCLEGGACEQDSQANCEATSGATYQGDGTSCDTVTCPVESDELLLMVHDDAPGGGFGNWPVSSIQRAAQYFMPSLPTNTLSWSVTRVRIGAQRAGAAQQQLIVSLVSADAARKPGNQVFDSVTIPEADLPTLSDWYEIPFSNVSGLQPVEGICLVCFGDVSVHGGNVRYENGGVPMTPNTHWMTSSDAGVSWTAPEQSNDMRFFLYGTFITAGPPEWP